MGPGRLGDRRGDCLVGSIALTPTGGDCRRGLPRHPAWKAPAIFCFGSIISIGTQSALKMPSITARVLR